jgi:hypothetical protein
VRLSSAGLGSVLNYGPQPQPPSTAAYWDAIARAVPAANAARVITLFMSSSLSYDPPLRHALPANRNPLCSIVSQV